MNIVQAEAVARLQDYAGKGLIIRDRWSGTDSNGQAVACPLTALVPGITSPRLCPATIIPQWLSCLTLYMNDEGTKKKWPAFVARYTSLAGGWHRLNDAAWRLCLGRVVSTIIQTTLKKRIRQIANTIWRKEAETIGLSSDLWFLPDIITPYRMTAVAGILNYPEKDLIYLFSLAGGLVAGGTQDRRGSTDVPSA